MRSGFIGVIVGALIATAVAVVAAPSPQSHPTERIAFVARNDVPFDALAVGPVAGAVGGIVVITSRSKLSDAAKDALIAFDPDEVIIAGGTAAISDTVMDAIEDAGDWGVSRAAGATRDETAGALAELLEDLDLGRPVLSGARQDGLQAQDLRHIEAGSLVPARADATANGDALRAAVAAADPFTPERIRLDRGTYELTESLEVPGSVTLVGADAAEPALTMIRCDTCSNVVELEGGSLESLAIVSTRTGGTVTGVQFTGSSSQLRDVTISLSGTAGMTGVHAVNHRSTEIHGLTLDMRADGTGNDVIGVQVEGSSATEMSIDGVRGRVAVSASGGQNTGRHAFGFVAGDNGQLTVTMLQTDVLTLVSGTPEALAEVSAIRAAAGSSVRLTGGSLQTTTAGGGSATTTGVYALGSVALSRTSLGQPGGTGIRVLPGSSVSVTQSDISGSISREGGNLDLRQSHVRFGISGAGGTFRCWASSVSFAGSFADAC